MGLLSVPLPHTLKNLLLPDLMVIGFIMSRLRHRLFSAFFIKLCLMPCVVPYLLFFSRLSTTTKLFTLDKAGLIKSRNCMCAIASLTGKPLDFPVSNEKRTMRSII